MESQNIQKPIMFKECSRGKREGHRSKRGEEGNGAIGI